MSPTDAYVRRLAELGAEIMHVPVEDVLGRSQRAAPAEVRIALTLALRSRGWGLMAIARALQRDHATVHHHVSRHALRLSVDDEYRYLVERLSDEAARLDGEARTSHSEEWLRRRIADMEGALDRLRVDFEALAAERANPVITRVGRVA